MRTDVSTEWYLEQWGRWAYVGRGAVRGFPSIAPFTRMLGSAVKEPMINDDEALKIDGILCELMRDYNAEGEAVALYFLGCFTSYRALGKHLRVTDKKVAYLIRAGVMWIDGRLQ